MGLSNEYTMRLMTVNYKGLQFRDHLEQMEKLIKKINPDAIGILGLRDYTDGSVIADLWRFLKPLGYGIQSQEGESVVIVIAHKIAGLLSERTFSWKNSDIPKENGKSKEVLAVEFFFKKEKSIAKKIKGKSKNKIIIKPNPDYSKPPIFLVNSPSGILSNPVIIEKIKEIVRNKPMFVVSIGDISTNEEEMNSNHESVDKVGSKLLINEKNVLASDVWCRKFNGVRAVVSTRLDEREIKEAAEPLNSERDLLRDKFPLDSPIVFDFIVEGFDESEIKEDSECLKYKNFLNLSPQLSDFIVEEPPSPKATSAESLQGSEKGLNQDPWLILPKNDKVKKVIKKIIKKRKPVTQESVAQEPVTLVTINDAV